MKSQLLVLGLGDPSQSIPAVLAALKIALQGRRLKPKTILLDIRELSLPMYDPADENPPHSVLYNATISGAFKNALDCLKLLGDRNPPYLTDKVIGLISTAGGMQGLQAVDTMEFVVGALRGWAVPLVMPIAQAWKVFDGNGVPHDVKLVEQLHALGREVARGSCQFVLEPPTRADAAKAEVELAPLSNEEAKSSQIDTGSAATGGCASSDERPHSGQNRAEVGHQILTVYCSLAPTTVF